VKTSKIWHSNFSNYTGGKQNYYIWHCQIAAITLAATIGAAWGNSAFVSHAIWYNNSDWMLLIYVMLDAASVKNAKFLHASVFACRSSCHHSINVEFCIFTLEIHSVVSSECSESLFMSRKCSVCNNGHKFCLSTLASGKRVFAILAFMAIMTVMVVMAVMTIMTRINWINISK